MEKGKDLNKGIERLTLLLSILVGTSIVFFTTLSDYTLNGTLDGPVEVLFGLMFLWSVGFASVWVIYGTAMFIVKGFCNLSAIQKEQGVVDRLAEFSPQYEPLPEKEQTYKSLLPWKKQVDKFRSAQSKMRIRLIDKAEQEKQNRPRKVIKILKFNCRHCGQKITVPDIHVGKKGQCLQCKKILIIPGLNVKQAAAASTFGNKAPLKRPTFVPREKVEAEERARVKAWEAIRDEVAPLAESGLGTKPETKETIRAEIERKVAEKVRPKTLAQAKAHAVLEAIRNARVEAEARIRAEAELKAKEITEALDKVRAETEAKIRAHAQINVKPAPKTTAKAATKTKTKAKAKSKTMTKAKAKAKPKVAAKAKANSKSKAKVKTVVKAAAKAKIKAKVSTAVKAKSNIAPKAKMKAQPKKEAEAFNILEVMQKVKKNTKMSKV